MCQNCFNCRIGCTGVAVIASIIVGVITAFLRITSVITVSTAFLWVALGIAVVFLAITLLVSAAIGERARQRCCCTPLSALVIGALGAVLTSVILLAITFAATSVVGAIITGALIAFSALVLTSTACLAVCLADCND